MKHTKFTNDYCGICHPEVLKALKENLDNQFTGYGLDDHSLKAEKIILKRFGLKDGSVFFLVGGTQTNMAVISYLLKPYEGAIACDSGHINVHETGAVEGSGHKIVTCLNKDGKIDPKDLESIILNHNDEHKVSLKLVYLSDSTETGSIYSLKELKEIRKICDKYGLYLFLDGARLACALTAKDNDIKPEDIAKLCDVFYVGGTKNGLLFGEAVVFKDKKLAQGFRYHIKNKGALLAKGFITGIEFETLFKDDLYFKIGKEVNDLAQYVALNIKDKVEFSSPYKTNQLFIRVNKKNSKKLIDEFGLELWEKEKDNDILRIVISYLTNKEDCDVLIKHLNNLV